MYPIITLVDDALQILTLLIVVRAVLTWIPTVDYRHPLIRLIVRITDPILLPVRRLMPPIGGFDLSPIIAILLVQFVGRLLVNVLASVISGA